MDFLVTGTVSEVKREAFLATGVATTLDGFDSTGMTTVVEGVETSGEATAVDGFVTTGAAQKTNGSEFASISVTPEVEGTVLASTGWVPVSATNVNIPHAKRIRHGFFMCMLAKVCLHDRGLCHGFLLGRCFDGLAQLSREQAKLLA